MLEESSESSEEEEDLEVTEQDREQQQHLERYTVFLLRNVLSVLKVSSHLFSEIVAKSNQNWL